jgi:hypothetical protein
MRARSIVPILCLGFLAACQKPPINVTLCLGMFLRDAQVYCSESSPESDTTTETVDKARN